MKDEKSRFQELVSCIRFCARRGIVRQNNESSLKIAMASASALVQQVSSHTITRKLHQPERSAARKLAVCRLKLDLFDLAVVPYLSAQRAFTNLR